jgi:hypothetical protein
VTILRPGSHVCARRDSLVPAAAGPSRRGVRAGAAETGFEKSGVKKNCADDKLTDAVPSEPKQRRG